MRQLLTVIRYELLMQLKSMRFKGVCAVILFIDFVMYMNAMERQEFDPRNYFLETDVLGFYLPPVIFAGLFCVGRIRTTGMHAILMVRPFSTYVLMLGQLIGALISCLIPFLLLFFVTGLVLHWQFDIDFPIPPLIHGFIFYITPAVCCVLALTIWIRTCFKNNLVSIIILSVIFFFTIGIGKSHLLNYTGPGGETHHNFVPMLSLFSYAYWEQLQATLKTPNAPFLQMPLWVNFALSIVYSNIFLILACYHLRRTEPHRKVIGTYGRRWFHMPTFLKMFCDLKIDPHMTYKTHLILAVFVCTIFAKVVWPLDIPYWKPVRTQIEHIFTLGSDSPAFENYKPPKLDLLTEDKVLFPHVLREEQYLSPDIFTSKLRFVLKQDPKGKTALMWTGSRWGYKPNSVRIDGRSVPFACDSFLAIDGSSFASCADGKEHELLVEAKAAGDAVSSTPGGVLGRSVRGYYFVNEKISTPNDNGGTSEQFDWWQSDSFPIALTLAFPSRVRLLSTPVKPVIKQAGKTTTYLLQIPPRENKNYSMINYSWYGDYEVLTITNSPLKLGFAVHRSYAPFMAQILDLARPVLEEFYQLHHISPSLDVTLIYAPEYGDSWQTLTVIRKCLNVYRRRGEDNWAKDELTRCLNTLEDDMLKAVLGRSFADIGVRSFRSMWDLRTFTERNLRNGLNASMSMKRGFQPKEFLPAPAMDPKTFSKIQHLSRKQLFSEKVDIPRIPIFQMLYLIMGHDDWQRMVALLKSEPLGNGLTPGALEKVVNQVSPKSLTWFFDYWFRTGTGFPCYTVTKATGRMLPDSEEGSMQYAIEAEIKNTGTGKMLVPVQLRTAKEGVSDKIWIGPGETVVWKTTSRYVPTFVEIDPLRWTFTAPIEDPKTKKLSFSARCDVKMPPSR